MPKKQKKTIKEKIEETHEKKIKEGITLWDIWSNNFYNAKRFFTSKGNLKTKSKIKDKWAKEFKKDIENFLQQWLKENL